jgi:hypothetical protein
LSKNGVSRVAGLMLVTLIGTPSAANSTRKASINPSTACLDAQYALWSGMDRTAPMDDMEMNAP